MVRACFVYVLLVAVGTSIGGQGKEKRSARSAENKKADALEDLSRR